jgi:hypothetical protein
MSDQMIVLRFGDLVTEEGGTISLHQDVIDSYGDVWWSWWMRGTEVLPRGLFGQIAGDLRTGNEVVAFLLNGRGDTPRLYKTSLGRVIWHPSGSRNLRTPSPERSPAYTHRGEYPAWFLLRSIEETTLQEWDLRYDSFPTRADQHASSGLIGEPVRSLDQMSRLDVTLWVVRMAKPTRVSL